MDPTEIVVAASDPGTVETLNAVIASVVALVTGVTGSLLAIFKLGLGKKDEKGLQDVLRELKDLNSHLASIKKVTDALADRAEHERMVSELHSALMDPSREVQRLLSAEEIKNMRLQLKELEELMKTHLLDDVAMSKAIGNISEAVDIMARKLKELSS